MGLIVFGPRRRENAERLLDVGCLCLQESQRAEYQRRVGLAFLRGEGVQRNAAVAAYFLRASADLGDAAAQCWLATCYAQGCKQQWLLIYLTASS